MSKPEAGIGAPPAYPPPVHQDAGPVPAHMDPRANPQGFNSPPPGQPGYQSPMNTGPPQPGYQSPMTTGPGGGYASPPPPVGSPYSPHGAKQGYYGPPPQGGPPGQPQQIYYGPPPPGGFPQQQQGYPPGMQQGYPPGARPYSQYERDRSRQNTGLFAGLLAILGACCCLDILF